MSFNEFPSPTPIFPDLPPQGFPVLKKPFFSAWEHKSVLGNQFQSARQVYPNWDFELQYGDSSWLREQTQNITIYAQNSPYKEFQEMSQLFLSCLGSYGEFYYLDPEDFSRTKQAIGFGDGTTVSFRVVRTWGISPLARVEPVGGVKTDTTINVYFNDVIQSSGIYFINNSPSGSFLVFGTPPANGIVITMDFVFYYRCRWLEDMQQYDQFLYNLFQLGKAKFRSVKP